MKVSTVRYYTLGLCENRHGIGRSSYNVAPPLIAPTPIYGPPPGLPSLGGYVWNTPLGSYHAAPSTVWSVTSASSRSSSPAGSSNGGSIGGTPTPSECYDVESVTAPVDIVSAMEALSVDDNLCETATDDWEMSPHAYEAPPATNEDLWATWEKPEEPTRPKRNLACTVHGPLCVRGICAEYKRQERGGQGRGRTESAEKRKMNIKTQKRHQCVEKPSNLRPRGGSYLFPLPSILQTI